MRRRLLAALLVLGVGTGAGVGGTGCAHHRNQGHSPVLGLMLLGGLVAGSALAYAYGSDEPCTDPAGRCGEETTFPPPPEEMLGGR